MTRCPLVLLTLFLMSTCAAEDYPFGRLFTDAGDREILDTLRKGKGDVTPEPVVPEEALPIISGEQKRKKNIRFSGFIRRADGSTVLWTDGASELSGQKPPGRMIDDTEASFRVNQQRQRLKPGQTWNMESDTVVEAYQSEESLPTESAGLQ